VFLKKYYDALNYKHCKMAGGLIQLVALGTQDTKLTKDAEISFFKSSYRPYVNFAMEAIEQTFSGSADFGKRFTAELSRSGDLVLDFLMEMTLPEIHAHQATPTTVGVNGIVAGSTERVQWVDNLANTMVKTVALNIGGQDIDKHYSEWFTIWNELTLPEAKRAGYNDLIGQQNLVEHKATGVYTDTAGDGAAPAAGTDYSGAPGTTVSGIDIEAPWSDFRARYSTAVDFKYWGLQTPKIVHPATKISFVPTFWFNENPGLALPLIALQYHQVKVTFELRPLSELYVLSANDDDSVAGLRLEDSKLSLGDTKLWVNYVFLEAAERRITAKKSHEYLITQLQFTGEESVTGSTHRAKLAFNHPCMELIWGVREDAATADGVNQWNNFETYTNTWLQGVSPVTNNGNTKTNIRGLNPMVKCKLQIHGQDRFAERDGDYFTRYQTFKYHSRVPTSRGIAVYSFSLNPESKQVNGTANFSRIDQPILSLNLRQINSGNTGTLYCFARNVNLFRVAGGMGGVAFAS
jgi:Major capsid protein N-terminus/Large eukaryotic DNA virus major capsid protein